MDNNKITTILLGAILAVGLGILIVSLQPKVQQAPNITVSPSEPISLGQAANEWYTTSSHTVVNVSSSTVGIATNQVLAANSGRQYARIQNQGNTRVSCIFESQTSTLAVGKGIVLFASTTIRALTKLTWIIFIRER